MIVYKAYQKLFNKVLNYKSELEQYKKLPTRSSISRNHMNKLVSDQSLWIDQVIGLCKSSIGLYGTEWVARNYFGFSPGGAKL